MAYDADLAERARTALRRATARTSSTREVRTFGPCFMVGGHMCCGVAGEDLVVRVGPRQVYLEPNPKEPMLHNHA